MPKRASKPKRRLFLAGAAATGAACSRGVDTVAPGVAGFSYGLIIHGFSYREKPNRACGMNVGRYLSQSEQ